MLLYRFVGAAVLIVVLLTRPSPMVLGVLLIGVAAVFVTVLEILTSGSRPRDRRSGTCLRDMNMDPDVGGGMCANVMTAVNTTPPTGFACVGPRSYPLLGERLVLIAGGRVCPPCAEHFWSLVKPEPVPVTATVITPSPAVRVHTSKARVARPRAVHGHPAPVVGGAHVVTTAP